MIKLTERSVANDLKRLKFEFISIIFLLHVMSVFGI